MARFKDKGDKFAKFVIATMRTEAGRSLSCVAKVLFMELKAAWNGRPEHNGKITLSRRQAAKVMNVSTDTIGRAFHELQAKGFIIVTRIGCPGVEGHGIGNMYELTDTATGDGPPKHLYKKWRKGRDFEVRKATANNPEGRNGRSKTFDCRERVHD